MLKNMKIILKEKDDLYNQGFDGYGYLLENL